MSDEESCQTTLREKLRSWEPLWGGWRVAEFLGSGSFGCVFLIEKDVAGKKMTSALKFIKLETRLDRFKRTVERARASLRRDMDEIARMCDLRYKPNLVCLEEADIKEETLPDRVTGYILIKMEYLPKSLASELEMGPLPWSRAKGVLKDSLIGLDQLHSLDIIHRDIKPENILLDKEGRAKVADFGVARTLSESKKARSYAGTELYMAPEVLLARYRDTAYDIRADLFSIGLVGYEMLEGSLPHFEETDGDIREILTMRMEGAPITWGPDTPNEARRILDKAMALRPEDRYSSAREMLEALERGVGSGAREKRDARIDFGKTFDGFDTPRAAPKVEPRPSIQEIITNSIGMEMKLIPPGSFMMGGDEYDDEKPVHKVEITRPFYLGIYPVTQEEWQKVMGDNPSHFKGDRNPVESVSWDDCQKFIKKLNSMEKTDRYRLPTEAEWEYACRGGSSEGWCFGDEESELEKYAWYGVNSGDKTHPVGELKPNAWGLYDMHGNVWEWCQDWFGDDYYENSPIRDPAGPSSGSLRVNRGGSWSSNADYCRSANRGGNSPEGRYNNLGVRLLRTVD